jgi:hypothetical protein
MAAIDFCSRAWPAPTKPGVSRASMIFRGQHPQGVRRWVPRRFAKTLPQWWRENRAGAIFVGAAHGRDCLFVRGHGPLLQKPGCFASRFDRLRTGTARCYKTWSFASFDLVIRGQHPQGVRRWVPRRFAMTLPQRWRENRAGAIFVGAGHARDCLFVRGHGPLLQNRDFREPLRQAQDRQGALV